MKNCESMEHFYSSSLQFRLVVYWDSKCQMRTSKKRVLYWGEMWSLILSCRSLNFICCVVRGFWAIKCPYFANRMYCTRCRNRLLGGINQHYFAPIREHKVSFPCHRTLKMLKCHFLKFFFYELWFFVNPYLLVLWMDMVLRIVTLNCQERIHVHCLPPCGATKWGLWRVILYFIEIYHSYLVSWLVSFVINNHLPTQKRIKRGNCSSPLLKSYLACVARLISR